MSGSPEYAIVEIAIFILTGLFSVLWFLLRKKDEAQEQHICAQDHQIEILFTKHDQDADRLTELELKIAEKHYLKTELDTKFDKLENALREEFKSMGLKFDNLANALLKNNG